MEDKAELRDELIALGLFDKAREIRAELGGAAAFSYIKSSYRLLSKVYHPDVNPQNREKAKVIQQSLNRVGDLISRMQEEDIIDLIIREPDRKVEGKKKILVVEDEFGLQEMFRDILLLEGYEVRVAVDGVQGYEAYGEFKPDLVFTDVVMPEMSGLELVRKIREVTPGIKVIYISGFFGIRRLKLKLDKDISEHGYPTLSKPFKASAMLDLVKDYLA
ncbi:MAG: response regulator [Nitrospirota bacterium]